MAIGTTAAILGGAAIAAPIVGGVVGQQMSKKDKAAAAAAMQRAVAELEKVGIPSIEAQQIVLENPQLVFDYTPELETFENLGPSEMQQVVSSISPEYKQAQMDALAKLQGLGETSFTEQEKASLNQLRRDAAQEEQAKQAQIIQNLAQRGAGGAGAELAARISSTQSTANRMSEESDRMAAMAQQRALEAIAQGGQMGTALREQEFGEKSAAAKAADAVAQFNLQNRGNVRQRNVESMNQAQFEKAKLKQGLEESRADTANKQELYNKGLLQQDFQNRMAKASGIAGAQTGQAGYYGQQAANTAQSFAQMGSGAGQGAAAGLQFMKPTGK